MTRRATASVPEESDASRSIDDRIVSALVENGRLTFAELGRQVGLSPHAAAERMRRLLASGVIRGFTAIVDSSRGSSYEALVDVRLQTKTSPRRFETFLAGLEDVQDAWFVTGRYDYVLRIVCRDATALDETVRTIRQGGGVAATETRVVMRRRPPG